MVHHATYVNVRQAGPPRLQINLTASPATAYRDSEGWVLFDADGEVIEQWPAGWPATVNRAFLKSRGVQPSP